MDRGETQLSDCHSHLVTDGGAGPAGVTSERLLYFSPIGILLHCQSFFYSFHKWNN